MKLIPRILREMFAHHQSLCGWCGHLKSEHTTDVNGLETCWRPGCGC